ncbi:hypothetical protein [Spirulina subsalsa]|nr:hypothetical protein [Spirulina subsalsa]
MTSMVKPLFSSDWSYAKPLLLLSTVRITASSPTWVEGDDVPTVMIPTDYAFSAYPPLQVADLSLDMIEPEVAADPLNSPHPIPWNWVMATYAEFGQSSYPEPRYYRSPALVSPDGEYAAYSRIQMYTDQSLYGSRVTSVMFLENLRTGDLQTITATSPLAGNPFNDNEEAYQPGAISILIPVSWSEGGDRLLARQFEGLFSTSEASDYGVVWDRIHNRTSTVSPTRIQYTNAVLLGWSTLYPQQVLFRAGTLGEDHWPLWAVNQDNETTLASEDRPIVYGQTQAPVWTGPQAQW